MSPAYRSVVLFLRLVIRIFFRRVEVTGRELVPERGGGVLVAWHPNALVDGLLILSLFPRQIVFGARHGLFRWPLLGTLLRRVGAVPIYRRGDDGAGTTDDERRARNAATLDEMARVVAEGSFAALFPEGVSHDEPYPLHLKPGAARLFYRARALASAAGPPPVILPVGLHYDRKRLLGSRALVAFHPPLALPAELAEPVAANAPEEARREQAAALTAELDRVLHDVVHATESWQLNELMHRIRKLVRAERATLAGARPDRPAMRERVLGFARVWTGYRLRVESHPDDVRRLLTRVRRYDEDLMALGIEDHELDDKARFRPALGLLLLQAAAVYFLMPAMLVFGYLVNLPTAALIFGVAKLRSNLYKDEATLKVLLGILLFPLTWLMAALSVAWGQVSLSYAYPELVQAPWVAGIVTFLLCFCGGLLALHYHRIVRQSARSLRVRLTRRGRAGAIRRLRKERSRIYESITRLTEGIDLPGVVAENGRVLDALEGSQLGR